MAKLNAWITLPRSLNHYEIFFAILAGIFFLTFAYRGLTGRGSWVRTSGTSRMGGGPTQPPPPSAYYIHGVLAGVGGSTLLALGVVGLLSKRRSSKIRQKERTQ